MNKLSTTLFLILALALTVNALDAVQYTPIMDTFVSLQNPATVCNSSCYMSVGSKGCNPPLSTGNCNCVSLADSNQTRIYLNFNVDSPARESAIIECYGGHNAGGYADFVSPQKWHLFRFYNKSWSEDNTTWNNQPLTCNILTGECNNAHDAGNISGYDVAAYYPRVYWNISQLGLYNSLEHPDVQNFSFMISKNADAPYQSIIFSKESTPSGPVVCGIVLNGSYNYFAYLRVKGYVNSYPSSGISVKACQTILSIEQCFTRSTDGDGNADFVLYPGMVEITSNYLSSGQIQSKTLSTGANYADVFFMSANGTCDSSYAGVVILAGGGVGNATVTAASSTKTYSGKTNSVGFFNLTQMEAGTYTITASYFGITKTFTNKQINLNVYDTIVLNLPSTYARTLVNISVFDISGNPYLNSLVGMAHCEAGPTIQGQLGAYLQWRLDGTASCNIFDEKLTNASGYALFDYRSKDIFKTFIAFSTLPDGTDAKAVYVEVTGNYTPVTFFYTPDNTYWYIIYVHDLSNISRYISGAYINFKYPGGVKEYILQPSDKGYANFSFSFKISASEINVSKTGFTSYSNKWDYYKPFFDIPLVNSSSTGYTSVSGFYRDNTTNSTPIMGLKVQARCYNSGGGFDRSSIGTTDSTGYYLLGDVLKSSTCRLETDSSAAVGTFICFYSDYFNTLSGPVVINDTCFKIDGFNTFSGKIKTQHGQAIVDVPVRVFTLNHTYINEDYTKSDGTFRIPRIPPGLLRVEFTGNRQCNVINKTFTMPNYDYYEEFSTPCYYPPSTTTDSSATTSATYETFPVTSTMPGATTSTLPTAPAGYASVYGKVVKRVGLSQIPYPGVVTVRVFDDGSGGLYTTVQSSNTGFFALQLPIRADISYSFEADTGNFTSTRIPAIVVKDYPVDGSGLVIEISTLKEDWYGNLLNILDWIDRLLIFIPIILILLVFAAMTVLVKAIGGRR